MNIQEDIYKAADNLNHGYETLSQIKEVDVATAPKTQVWKRDKVTLHRYSRETPPTVSTPVLVCYALVNTYEMMDLQPDRSYIRNLLNLGLDIYMVDWGYPTRADQYITMDDYINGYLNDAVDFVKNAHGIPAINLMGVCQGGTFSAIYSALYPKKIKNLITLVTPIDFSSNDALLFRWSKKMDIDRIVDSYGTVPGEFLNQGFSLMKPTMKINKAVNLMNIMKDGPKLMNFLRMEKWINDSPDQAGACYRQFLKEFYQENRLVNGTLELGGKKVNLKNISMPLLNIYATEDHLVPPASSIPFVDLVGTRDAQTYKFAGGHIGVFVGGKSQKELAPAVATWLNERDN